MGYGNSDIGIILCKFSVERGVFSCVTKNSATKNSATKNI
jgi:hypothetical protein